MQPLSPDPQLCSHWAEAGGFKLGSPNDNIVNCFKQQGRDSTWLYSGQAVKDWVDHADTGTTDSVQLLRAQPVFFFPNYTLSPPAEQTFRSNFQFSVYL